MVDLNTQARIQELLDWISSLKTAEEDSGNHLESLQIFEIRPTLRSPHMILDNEKGFLFMKDRLADENGKTLLQFNTFLAKLENFDRRFPGKSLVASFCFDMIHEELERLLLYFFRCMALRGNTTVNWFFDKDDNEMLSIGKDLESVVKLPFCFIELDINGRNLFGF